MVVWRTPTPPCLFSCSLRAFCSVAAMESSYFPLQHSPVEDSGRLVDVDVGDVDIDVERIANI
eukprot:SAG31_NODE_4575_length_3124_cov_2.054545_6_plen_63_part_00